jgi:hypothetical protein
MGGSDVAAGVSPGGERRGRAAAAAVAVAIALLLTASLGGPPALGSDADAVVLRGVTTADPVLAGDPIVATATVENRADRPAVAVVRLVVDGRVDRRRIRLAAGERAAVRLRLATGPDDAGVRRVAVAVGGDRTVVGATVADELVSECRDLDDPGVYALAADVRTRTAVPCLDVTAPDVVLVGGGHAVAGGDAPGPGVRVAPSAPNATLRDLRVRDWATGVAVAGDGATVRGLRATGNADHGMAVRGADGLWLTATSLSRNGDGLYLADADGAHARNLTITGSARDGVDTGGNVSTGVRLTNVTVTDAAAAGIDAGAAVGLRGERVALDDATVSFAATRARLARGDLRDLPSIPAGRTAVGPAVAVETATDGRATVTLHYDDRDARRVIEPTLVAWRHGGSVWRPVGGSVDPSRNALIATVTGDGVVVAAGEHNDPPAASVTATPDRVGVDQPVTVDAGDTTDPDGRGVVAYAWDLDGDGRVDRRTRMPRLTHTYGTTGPRTVGVRATDADGATATATVDVTVVDASTDGGGRPAPGGAGAATSTTASRPTGEGSATATGKPGREPLGDEAGALLVVAAVLVLLAAIVRGRRRGR